MMKHKRSLPDKTHWFSRVVLILFMAMGLCTDGEQVNAQAQGRLGRQIDLRGRHRKEQIRLRTSEAWLNTNFSWIHWWEMNEKYFFPNDKNNINPKLIENIDVHQEYIDEMRASLRGDNLELKRDAVLTVGQLKLTEMKDDVVKLTKGQDLVLRCHAWIALGMMNESVVTLKLVTKVEDAIDVPTSQKDTKIERQIEAVQILALGFKESLTDDETEFLYDKLKEFDKRKDRSNDALECLLWVLRIHKPDRTQDIMRRVFEKAKHPYVVNQAMMTLGENRDAEAQRLLMNAIITKSKGRHVIEAIRKLNELYSLNQGSTKGQQFRAAADGLRVGSAMTLAEYANDDGKANRIFNELYKRYITNIRVNERAYLFARDMMRKEWQEEKKVIRRYNRDVGLNQRDNYVLRKFIFGDLNWLSHYGSNKVGIWRGTDSTDREIWKGDSDITVIKKTMTEGPEKRFGLMTLGLQGNSDWMDIMVDLLELEYVFPAGHRIVMQENPNRGCAAISLGLYMMRKSQSDENLKVSRSGRAVRHAFRAFQEIFENDQESEQTKVAVALALGLSQNPEAIEILRAEARRCYSPLEAAFIAQSLAMLGDKEGSSELNRRLMMLISNVDENGKTTKDKRTTDQEEKLTLSPRKNRYLMKTILSTAARFDMTEEHSGFWRDALMRTFGSDQLLDWELIRIAKIMNEPRVGDKLLDKVMQTADINSFKEDINEHFDMDKPYSPVNMYFYMNKYLEKGLESRWDIMVNKMNFALPNEITQRDKAGLLQTSTLAHFRCYADPYFMLSVMRPNTSLWY